MYIFHKISLRCCIFNAAKLVMTPLPKSKWLRKGVHCIKQNTLKIFKIISEKTKDVLTSMDA